MPDHLCPRSTEQVLVGRGGRDGSVSHGRRAGVDGLLTPAGPPTATCPALVRATANIAMTNVRVDGRAAHGQVTLGGM